LVTLAIPGVLRVEKNFDVNISNGPSTRVIYPRYRRTRAVSTKWHPCSRAVSTGRVHG